MKEDKREQDRRPEFGGTIPARGHDRDEILALMRDQRGGDVDWKAGKVWSLVYHAGEQHTQLLRDAYGTFLSENYLDPFAFGSLKRMEHDVVRMTADMLNGDPQTVGTMTSGGTESILLAVKAARDRARRKWPWIRKPEVVAPVSAHVAFSKACKYFGLKLIRTPVRDDFRADVRAMKKRVGRNTVLLVGSAAQYPQGVVDPIEEIGALAQKKKLPFHVDSCIGGFMLPWLEKLGYPIPTFDFRVPGVTSMSADVHKYGYAAKGASVVVYRNMTYLRHQFYVCTDWTGGIYASPTIAGTRPGGAIAAAWAAMQHMGQDGYEKIAGEAMQACERMIEGLETIPEVRVLGKPDMPLLSYASNAKDVDIFVVADQLEKKGWHMDRLQVPPAIHATVTSNHADVIDGYVDEVRGAVAYSRAHPEASQEGNAAMYGMMAKIPLKGMVSMGVIKIMESIWGPDGENPDLSTLGEGDDDDPMFKLMNRVGPVVTGTLERLDETVSKVRTALRPGSK